MIEPVVLSSAFRRTMVVKDNEEGLVDLRTHCPEVKYQIADYLVNSDSAETESDDAHFVRKSVADMIQKSQQLLPTGLFLLVRCGYRTPEVQDRQYRIDYEDLRREHPSWSTERLDLEIVKRTDPPDIGPHCTGGAIDLSLVDLHGKPLDMGTNMGEFTNKSFTYNNQLTIEQRTNRQILLDAMETVGFLNFPAEWWHFSYGDRDWAYVNETQAFYGQIVIHSYQNAEGFSEANLAPSYETA
jgi:zinc D-Ala-D-Ala dipeptidase